MNTVTVKIDGMTCQHCVMAVKKALMALPLNGAKVEIGSAEIDFDPEKVTMEEIESAIAASGYTVVH